MEIVKIGEKTRQIAVICQIRLTFLLPKFLLHGIMYSMIVTVYQYQVIIYTYMLNTSAPFVSTDHHKLATMFSQNSLLLSYVIMILIIIEIHARMSLLDIFCTVIVKSN